MIAGDSTELEEQARPCSILLVEDNKINQKVVVLMLARFGIEPAVADNGTQALEIVRDKKFDLILMDLHMPGMDGIEATRRIRQELGLKCPPVVALTADVYSTEEANGTAAILDGYLMKPISSDQLRRCISDNTDFKL